MIFRVHFKPTFLGCIFQNNSRIISITHNASCHLHALSHSTIYRCRSKCSYCHPHFIDANTETQKGDLMGRKTEIGGLVTMLYYFFLFFFKISFIYLREREHKPGKGRSRLPSKRGGQHRAQSHNPGIMTWPWDHDLSWRQMLNQLSHPGAPASFYC